MPQNRQAPDVSHMNGPAWLCADRMNWKVALILILLPAPYLAACSNLGDLTLVGIQAEKFQSQKDQSELRIVAEYTSSKDLSQFDKSMLWGGFFLCQRPNAPLALGPLKENIHPTSDLMAPPEKFGSPPYKAIFRVAFIERLSSNPPRESFDLRQQPQDVCFRLEQGPYARLNSGSGILMIPKEKIAAALLQSKAAEK